MDFGPGPAGPLLHHQHDMVPSVMPRRFPSSATNITQANSGGHLHSNVYVKGFGADWDEPLLQSYFEPYGVILSCKIVRNTRPGPSLAPRSYGFVKLGSVEQARSAIAALNGCALGGGSLLEVKFADQDASSSVSLQQPSDNLYVRNLSPGWTESGLAELFSQFGAVRECRVLSSNDPVKAGGALVRMGTVDEATRAIDGLNNSFPPGAALPLVVRYADTPEEKARKLAKRERLSLRYAPYGSPQHQTAPHMLSGQPGDAADMMQQQQQTMIGHPPSGGLPAGFTAFDGSGNGPQQANGGGPFVGFDADAAPPFPPFDMMQPGGGGNVNGGNTSMFEAGSGSGGGGSGGPFDAAGGGNPNPFGGPPMPQQPQTDSSAFDAAVAAAAGQAHANIGGYDAYLQPPACAVGATMPQPSFGSSSCLGGMAANGQQAGSGGPGSGGQVAGGGGSTSSIYVKNLPPETDRLFLYERFAPFGGVLSVKVLQDDLTGQCRGVGFVNFVDATAAAQAVSTVHNTRVGDRLLHVSLQTPRMR